MSEPLPRLILDLDETLIHAVRRRSAPQDHAAADLTEEGDPTSQQITSLLPQGEAMGALHVQCESTSSSRAVVPVSSSPMPWTTCRRLVRFGSLFVIATWPISYAHAIVRRDDVPDADFVVADADYPAVVTLFPPDDCGGTLIHAAHLLTVAHCAVDLIPGDSVEIGATQCTVAEVTLHPQWQDDDHYDIAVVRFADRVEDVDPVPIYRGVDELGALVSLVGRGVTATGLEGESGGRSDGQLRRATNVVSHVDEFLLEVVFERPDEEQITGLEGVGASGDSGGPVFLEVDGTLYLAGLNAFGDSPEGIGIAQYGSLDYQTRVSSYADWIDDALEGRFQGSSSASGCACAQGSNVPGSVLLLVVLAALRRRDRWIHCRRVNTPCPD